MPNKNDEQPIRRPGLLRRVANFIQGNSNSLYKSTYYSDPEEKYQLQRLSSEINNTIKNIMNNTTDSVGEPNIVKLYERLLSNNSSDKKLTDEFNRLFGDNEFVGNLTASYLDNRWVRTIDMEIDEICKYMPKLNEALETIADNVLSADSFAKDYLNLENSYGNSKSDEHKCEEKALIANEEQYFISKKLKYIFALNHMDGEERNKIINLTDDLYEDAEAAKKWYRDLVKLIHPDINLTVKKDADEAMINLRNIYDRIVRSFEPDTDDTGDTENTVDVNDSGE